MNRGRGPGRSAEKDSLYCPFYQKNGACMHGNQCSRMHMKPQSSKTILLVNMYPNPHRFVELLPRDTLVIDSGTINRNFDEFYMDIYEELRTFGPIEDMLVAGNLCEHLVGNILVRYQSLEDAIGAQKNLRGRFYAGRPIDAQFSPVEDFQMATCKQLTLGGCNHDTKCNFIHPLYPSEDVLRNCPLTGHIWEEDELYMLLVHRVRIERPREDDRRHPPEPPRYTDRVRDRYHDRDDRDRHYDRGDRRPPDRDRDRDDRDRDGYRRDSRYREDDRRQQRDRYDDRDRYRRDRYDDRGGYPPPRRNNRY